MKKDKLFQILIVDDNAEIREIVQEYLADSDCQIEGASNGKEALEKYNENPYDIIITDLKMPGISGIELIKLLKQKTDTIEFVIITGYASVDTAIEAVRIGAFDYIVKPFRMEELKVTIKNAKEKIILKRANEELLDKLKRFHSEIEKYKKYDAEKNTSTESVDEEQKNHTERLVDSIKYLGRLSKNRLMIE
ncbi:MAG TPA: response regulator [Syntrophorhabdaceae bacterium]|jgi:DNA-binding NtrC family response regulator|nr:response regulator [Pseudomonadota bacterium]HNQ64087.1 response regulator [Syntrophorhabdaceae bacterium]HOG40057.1 response regulator [Syntrophorhabdaceae bacterium]HPH42500.1 response regulator [Syntrophorhabdaceae bacterium]HPN98316.1 response regulator [Syntrophorhabdaceae bacterium]